MQKKPEDSRRAVLNSAIEVFARKGYAGASVMEILAATGLSKPTLYYHFENKAGLFRAILDFAFDEPFRLMGEAVAGGNTTEQKLVGIARALFEFCSTNQDLTRLALAAAFAAAEEIPSNSIKSSKRRRNFEFVQGVIRKGQQVGELDPRQDTVELSHGIYGSISHQIRMYLIAPTGRLDGARAKRVVALFLNGARQRN